MNDDDLSELILRASAYLDGELDAAEMARAEADPAVMAEVAALRELQEAVREVPAASDAARESAITAALAEFDALNAAHVPVPPADDEPLHVHRPHAPVVPFRPRPSYTRWLTAAAAVVAVGLLGVVVVNGVGGGDDEATTAGRIEDSAATAPTRTAEAEVGAAEIAEPTAEAGADTEAPAAAPELAASDEAGTFIAPATTTAPIAGSTMAGSTMAAIPPFDPEQPITSIEELAAVGFELLAGEAAGTVARNVETRCDLAPFEPYQRGLYDDGTGAREVIIAIDPSTLQTGAFDEGDCAQVAVTPFP